MIFIATCRPTAKMRFKNSPKVLPLSLGSLEREVLKYKSQTEKYSRAALKVSRVPLRGCRALTHISMREKAGSL